MKFTVRVWDCTAETDIPSREVEFLSWDKAMKYINDLPSHEGGTVERKIDKSR